MPYIGKEPVAGNFVLLDSITTSATATYALTKDSVAYSPESARNMIVSLNGVTQAPEAAFTVSGSNITFSSALTSSDVIDYILVLGDVLSVGTPSDGTVGTSQMSYPLGNFSSTGIDDNATSTAITIDGSENVGIGTTTPVSLGAGYKNLDIRHTTGGGVTLGDTSNIHAYLFSDNNGVTLQSPGSRSIKFTTVSTERMRIDSSGNVGIGTASPSSIANYVVVEAQGDTTTTGGIYYSSSSDSSQKAHFYIGGGVGYLGTQTTHPLAFTTNNTERMRIDDSGRLLIGKTAVSNSTAGYFLEPGSGGYASFVNTAASANNRVLLLNREGGDGAILECRRANTTVGKISSEGYDLAVGNGDAGVQFVDGTRTLRPFNITTNARADNSIDLGMSTTRWKDLYLSGGVYLGGTGAANHLDDYEEGTFTVTPTFGTSGSATLSRDLMSYTKIGQVVYITGQIQFDVLSSPTGLLTINIPFAVKSPVGSDRETNSFFVGTFQSLNAAPPTGSDGDQFWITPDSSTITIQFYNGYTNTATDIDSTYLKSGSRLTITGWYLAA